MGCNGDGSTVIDTSLTDLYTIGQTVDLVFQIVESVEEREIFYLSTS